MAEQVHLHKPFEACDDRCPPLDVSALVERMAAVLKTIVPDPEVFGEWAFCLDLAEGFLATIEEKRDVVRATVIGGDVDTDAEGSIASAIIARFAGEAG